jgi:hypothetical protein
MAPKDADMNKGNMRINSRHSRLGAVVSLAMVSAFGAGCSVQSDAPKTATTTQFISTPLAATPTFVVTPPASGIVTVTMNDEVAEIYLNPADSSLMINGVQAKSGAGVLAYGSGAKANIATLIVKDTAGTRGDILILNYVNGVFGLGTVAAGPVFTAGTQLALAPAGMGVSNTLIVKATTAADNYAAGQSGISLNNGAHVAPAVPSRDIAGYTSGTPAGTALTSINAYEFFLSDGDDVFTSSATTATGAVFATPTVGIFGGNGNDTLNEGAVVTPNETFSGGSGVDTVDYSLRTTPVWVAVDAAGIKKSGAATLTTCTWVLGGQSVEVDTILDADVIKGGTGDDFLASDHVSPPGSTTLVPLVYTLNGGLGNDRFCQGNDANFNSGDSMVGGGGIDTVDYSARANLLKVDMGGTIKSGDIALGNASATVKGENDVIAADISNVAMGSGGTAYTNVVPGVYTAASVYTGNPLDNTFFAGTGGFAVVNGLAGNDTLDEGTDLTSTVVGAGACDPVGPPICADNSVASEMFFGGAGLDSVDYRKRAIGVYLKMDGAFKGGAGVIAGGTGTGTESDVLGIDVENLYGGAGADHLEGNLLDNDIEGRGGGDTVCGGLGNDTLIGNITPADAASTAFLHGNDCADAVAESGAFNLCLLTGTTGTPAAVNSQNCQFVTH